MWSPYGKTMERSVSSFKAKYLAIREDVANKKQRVVIPRYGSAADDVISFSEGAGTPLSERAADTTQTPGNLPTSSWWPPQSRLGFPLSPPTKIIESNKPQTRLQI